MYKLNPALRSFWEHPARNKVLPGGRASSKCLAVGTKVIMFDGSLKKVEDVIEGDLLMGPDSKPRTVLSTTKGVDELYSVSQSSAMDYVVNKDHILSLQRTKSSYSGKKLISGEISPRYPELGHIHNMNVVDYMNASDKFKVNFIGYKCGLISFPKKDVPLEPYMMGLWLGDGDCDNAIITTMDEEVVFYLEEFAQRNDMVCSYVGNNGSKANKWRVKEKERHVKGNKGSSLNRINKALRGYGIFTYFEYKEGERIRVKREKRIPEDYIVNDEKTRLELLAGIVDTDGTYLKARGSMVVSSSSENFANDLKRLVDNLGFKSSLIERETSCQGGFTGKAWFVTFSGDLERVPCKIKRKIAKNKENAKNHLLTYVKVTPKGKGEYAGFSVDGDHLFLLEDGTVTHNSHDAAGNAVRLASKYTLKILCARRFQARIAESVYTLVKNKIIDSPFFKDWKILKTSMVNIKTGSEFLFFGIERNLLEIKSTEGVDILWLEEANYITEEHWEVLEPTIRKDTSEVWFIFNPDEATDFVYDHFVLTEQPETIIRPINWDENPWLSDTMIRIIQDMYDKDPVKAEHIYGGKPKSGGDKSIIRLDYIEAAIDAHKNPMFAGQWDNSGVKRVGFDVADDGDDKCAMAHVEGNILVHVEEWEGLEDELLKSCTRVWNYARENGTAITYDSVGVGATAGSKFKELNSENKMAIQYDAFNAGGAVENPDNVYMELPHTKILNKDHFENVKAQKWEDVASKFRKTFEAIKLGVKHPISDLISIDSSRINSGILKQLKKELSCVRKGVSGRGKFMAEKKEELIKRGIKSPNIADAVIMAAMTPKRKPRGFFD